MTQQEKLIAKFKLAKKPLSWTELTRLMTFLGFESHQGAGSRVLFIKGSLHLRLHRPHPQKEVKEYVLKQVKATLLAEELI